MANKKIFSIQINGLDESVRSVDALTEKIQNLQKLINSMKGKGVEIPLEVGGENLVKELKAISNKVKSATKGALPLDAEKEYLNLLKQRQKALDAVNKEMGDTGKNAAEFRQETKELVAQEVKARNEAKTYTNTLAGLKAELKDLKASIQNIDFNSDVYKETADKIYVITQRLKELEAEQNTFGRNVGNYRDAAEYLNDLQKEAEEAKEEAEKLRKTWEELYKKIDEGKTISDEDIRGKFSVNQLNAELSSLKANMDDAISEEDYEAIKKYYDALKIVSDQFKRFRGEVVKADNQLKTQLQRTINGQEYTWENLTSAVGELEDKLYQMAANGQKNTAEFQNIAKAAAELKTQLRQVDYEIDSMTESSKGIAKMVSYAQGFTAIAQGAQGFGQLFGMEDENSLKGIQTLQSLQSIAMSLQTIKELSRQGTAFGKMLDNWVTKLEAFAVASSNVFKDWSSQLTDIHKLSDFTFQSMADGMIEVTKNSSKFQKFIIDPTDIGDLKTYAEVFQLTANETDKFEIALKELSHQQDITNAGVKTAGDYWKEFGFTLQKIWATMKMGGRELRDIAFNTLPFLSKIFPKVNTSISATADGLVTMGTGAKLASVGVKVLNVSLKALAAALAATGVFLLVEALIWLVGVLSDGVKWLYQWAVGNDKLVDSTSALEGRLNALNTATENYIRQLERLNQANKLSDMDKAAMQYQYLEKAIHKAANELKEFVKLRGDQKKLEDNFSDDGLTQTWDFSSLAEFRAEYEKLLKAVESGTDVKQQGGNWLEKLWYTKKDAKSDLGVMQKRVIQDIQDKINNLDLSKGTQELENFFKIMEDEMYRTSIDNIENLFPEEEWASVLKQRLETLKNFYDQSTEAAIQAEEVARQRTKTIRDNYTEGIFDDQKRETEALQNQKRDEIELAKKDKELEASINAKYRRLEQELSDRYHKEELDKLKDAEEKKRDLLREIRDNYLSAESESLAKTLEEINNQRNDAIQDAWYEAEKLLDEGVNMWETYNELVASINAKYDAEIEREKTEYYANLVEKEQQYFQDIEKVRQQISSDRLDAQSQNIDIEYNMGVNSSSGSFDFNARYGDLIAAEKQFNADRLALELDYLNKKKKMDDEYATFEKDDAILQENDRYTKALEDLAQFKEDGYATEVEYNNLLEQEEELHKAHMEQIDARYKSQLETREAQHQNEIKETISTSLKENAALYEVYSQQVQDILSEVGREVNAFGVMDFGAAKTQMNEALKVVKQGMKDIDDEMADLDKQKNAGKISFIDYKEAKQQLQQLKENLEQEGRNIAEMQTALLYEVAMQWKSMVDQWVGTISSLLQTLNDTQMQIIENQLAEVEYQLEIQEEAYDRAEEAAEEHKNKMDDIEDELAEARGSRRQFLIDTYAAQQAAYLEDLAAQQKAAEEKEKLEKKQQALEKKRKQQEKKANVQQALINTFTAVSNALAVQPWFVGLALSAVALGIGMANVAAIKNTPIYEDGGVISGPRHSQGGVKVLGGTAEVEGGEYITNRKSTAANLPLLTYINDQKRELTAEDLMKFFASGTPKFHSRSTRMFADGGQLPTTNTEVNRVIQVNDASNDNVTYVVQVTDIINATDNLRKVQTLSGLYNE